MGGWDEDEYPDWYTLGEWDKPDLRGNVKEVWEKKVKRGRQVMQIKSEGGTMRLIDQWWMEEEKRRENVYMPVSFILIIHISLLTLHTFCSWGDRVWFLLHKPSPLNTKIHRGWALNPYLSLSYIKCTVSTASLSPFTQWAVLSFLFSQVAEVLLTFLGCRVLDVLARLCWETKNCFGEQGRRRSSPDGRDPQIKAHLHLKVIRGAERRK